MPLYEQLRDEQRARREQVRHMTKEYLNSISKPFGFDSRAKAKSLTRRHSYPVMIPFDVDLISKPNHYPISIIELAKRLKSTMKIFLPHLHSIEFSLV